MPEKQQFDKPSVQADEIVYEVDKKLRSDR